MMFCMWLACAARPDDSNARAAPTETGPSASETATPSDSETESETASETDADPPPANGSLTDGIVLRGSAGADIGRNISVGDLSGDGVDDVLAASHEFASGDGGASVVFGPAPMSGDITASGVTIGADAAAWGAGRSSGVADVTGDGVADAALGVPFGVTQGLWVVAGPMGPSPSLSSAAAVVQAPSGSYCGHGSAVGELTGDGIGDAVIGCYSDDTAGNDAGAVYVVPGPLAGTIPMQSAATARWTGEMAGVYAGRFVAAGKDVDGDGVGDIVVSGPSASLGPLYGGAVFVCLGPPVGGSFADADGWYVGESSSSYAGESLNLGDVDGDGRADVLIGSGDDTGGAGSGAAYVLFGPASGTGDLATADIIVRGAPDEGVGTGLAGGDADGDGDGDLVLGASGAAWGGVAAGRVFRFDAPATGVWTTADASQRWDGEQTGDQAGFRLDLAWMDGPVLVVGAPGMEPTGQGEGSLYLLWLD